MSSARMAFFGKEDPQARTRAPGVCRRCSLRSRQLSTNSGTDSETLSSRAGAVAVATSTAASARPVPEGEGTASIAGGTGTSASRGSSATGLSGARPRTRSATRLRNAKCRFRADRRGADGPPRAEFRASTRTRKKMRCRTGVIALATCTNQRTHAKTCEQRRAAVLKRGREGNCTQASTLKIAQIQHAHTSRNTAKTLVVHGVRTGTSKI